MGLENFLLQGLAVALTPLSLISALIGAFAGTIIGLLPGIGPINGIAILLPFVYRLGLPPENALILLAGIYYGAEYGGCISSILINIPGEAGTMMTAIDGHPLAKQGQAKLALSTAAVSSFTGGTIAVIGLTFLGPLVAEFAIHFSPADYFALMVFSFICLCTLLGNDWLKTLISITLGAMLATVGIDSSTGVLRFTAGQPYLYDGIDFVIVVTGFFAVSELLTIAGNFLAPGAISFENEQNFNERGSLHLSDFLFCRWTILRGALIGFIVGILPGTGASIASAVSYTAEKYLNNRQDTFGKGDLRGVAAPESANNAAAIGAFVPMLTLGIPGSGTTAILLGALLIYNIQPGPLLFQEQPEIVGGLIASMYLGNLILLVLNLPLVGWFARCLLLPNWLLFPSITVLAFVGVYSIDRNVLSLFLMLLVGLLGYFLRLLNFSLIPLILGFVLSSITEENLRRAFAISGGDIGILFQSRISQFIWLLSLVVVLILPLVKYLVVLKQPSN